MTDAIDAAELCRLSSPFDVAVSPDGDRVAFTAVEWDQDNDSRHTALYVVPADGSAPPHRLSRVSDAGPPKWSPDGSMLGFVGAREEDLDRRVGMTDDDEGEDANGNDEPKPQVWAFNLDRGGDAIQLTDREWGVREFDWGPAADRIVISARDPTDDQEEYLERLEDDGPIEIERLQHKINGVGFTDDVTTYLFVVDIESGETRRLDETAAAGAFEQFAGVYPAWQPDGDKVAFLNATAERPDDSVARDLHLVDVEDGSVERLTDLGAALISPSWSPDGEQLAVSGRDEENWYLPTDVYVVDAATGAVTTVTEAIGATVSWFAFPEFIDETTLIAGLGDAGRTRLYRFASDGSVAEPLSIGFDEDTSSLRTIGTDGGIVAFVRTDPGEGIDVFAIDSDIDDAQATRLTSMNASFFDERPAPEFVRAVSPNDSIDVESMVYHDESFDPDDPSPQPTIIWTHGGPMSYDDPEFRFDIAYFTSRGYLVVKPNYRGSTSYGAEFAEVLKGKWGTVEADDTLAVVDDLVDRGWIDEERLFAMGFSYGGIMTGFLITRSDRFTAAAAEHGIYDLRSEFGTSDSHVWLGQEFGLPWEDEETYDAGSSILDVEGTDTPTLLTAGGQDWRCPPTQSEQLYVALRKQGTPAKLVVYPDENHDISAPERAIHRLETIEEWFEQYDPDADGETA